MSDITGRIPGLRFLVNRAIMFDPGLRQLRLASRVVVTVAVTVALLWGLSGITGIQLRTMALGFVVSLFACSAVRDPSARGRILTMLLLPLPALACAALASVLSRWPAAQNVTFLALIFGAIYARRFGPRWVAFGLLSFMAFFMTVFLRTSLGQMPDQVIGIVIGITVAVIVRFVLITDNPPQAFRFAVRAVEIRMSYVLTDLCRAVAAHGRWTRTGRRHVHQNLARLNEAALVVAEQRMRATRGGASGDEDGRRLTLLRLGLAIQRLAILVLYDVPEAESAAVQATQAETETGERRRMVAEFSRIAAGLWHGKRRFGEPPAPGPFAPTADRGDGHLRRVGLALAQLEMALGAAEGAVASPVRPSAGDAVRAADRTDKEAGANGAGGKDERTGADNTRDDEGWWSPPLRVAIQATTASAVAVAFGHLVSDRRWYWAVITSFIVFMGTTSRGDALLRGLQRTFGTVGGVVAGILLAEAVSGDRNMEMLLILPCIFLAFYFFQRSYAVMIFWITMVLALLYEVIGFFSESILWLRLEETAIGAAISIVVARFLFPARTGPAVRGKLLDLLGTLDAVVEEVTARFGKGDGDRQGARAPLDLAHDLNDRFQNFRNAARPLTLGWEFHAPGVTPSGLARAMVCAYWGRELCLIAASCEASGPGSPEMGAACRKVRNEIAELRRALDEHRSPALDSAADDLRGIEDELRPLLTESVDGRAAENGAIAAIRALRRLEEALRALSRHVTARRGLHTAQPPAAGRRHHPAEDS